MTAGTTEVVVAGDGLAGLVAPRRLAERNVDVALESGRIAANEVPSSSNG